MQDILKTLRTSASLTESEMTRAVTLVLDGGATPAQIGAFLMALSMRGETAEEITTAAKILRSRVHQLKSPEGTLDCCGTGGDHSNSLNISTAVSFVVAACGIPVAKHGNRAASSKSGAADVLEQMGVSLALAQDQCEEALRETGFCFLMAPNHHTALKPLAALRKELGFRTIFNLLGPLVNPALPRFQLLGVSDKRFLLPIAETLRNLGTQSAWVVHGSDGMDEITLSGPTYAAILGKGTIEEKTLTPEDFGVPLSSSNKIKGGDAKENARRLEALLNGEKDDYRNIVLMNAAACLMIAGKEDNPKKAVELAAKAIDTGSALKLALAYKNFTTRLSGDEHS